ncbi:hypothetical protein [Curtobacterium sp. MCPF17_052]|uniref:hypothetical protein n=1 Tax=Curtobacterium sp. MCPF17_052 TaxID=2175655 RepID=UPI0024DF85CC|nr:hypothetical protein [Curtobacterium sp. MCPF17_052]WIB12820.1 hypothetical protein DEJ36_01745 [Curtobacterium sp. MCPF17_052]
MSTTVPVSTTIEAPEGIRCGGAPGARTTVPFVACRSSTTAVDPAAWNRTWEEDTTPPGEGTVTSSGTGPWTTRGGPGRRPTTTGRSRRYTRTPIRIEGTAAGEAGLLVRARRRRSPMTPGTNEGVVELPRSGGRPTPVRRTQHGVVELVLVVLHVRLLRSAPQP